MIALRVPDEMLLAYATGALTESLSLVVASHIALNERSRADVEAYEAVGGALFESLAPSSLSDDALSRTLAEIDRLPDEDEAADEHSCRPVKPHAAPAEDPVGAAPADGLLLPSALRAYVGPDIDALTWKPTIRGVEEAEIRLHGAEGPRTRLMRIEPGVGAPRHTHGGMEVTLVLDGAYRDATGRYARGDVQVADDGVEHEPVAEGERTCLCLVVSDAPIKLTGFFGRLLNPFIRY
jgi:putative transcriptional regulator